MDLEKIGKFIKERRQELGLTQKQLADTFGITAKAVSKWECGQNAPDISLLNDLSAVLNVTINEILNGCKDSDIEKQPIIDKIATKKLRIKTIIEIILVFLVLVASSLAVYFGRYYSKYYNKCSIYKLHAQSTELNISGYIIDTNNKMTIMLGNFLYTGLKDEPVTECEINLELNNKIILSNTITNSKARGLINTLKEQSISFAEEIYMEPIESLKDNKITMTLNINYTNMDKQKQKNSYILKLDDYYSN